MKTIKGNVRVRDQHGRDVFYKIDQGLSFTGFRDDDDLNSMLKSRPHEAIEQIVFDEAIRLKDPTGKEGRHP